MRFARLSRPGPGQARPGLSGPGYRVPSSSSSHHQPIIAPSPYPPSSVGAQAQPASQPRRQAPAPGSTGSSSSGSSPFAGRLPPGPGQPGRRRRRLPAVAAVADQLFVVCRVRAQVGTSPGRPGSYRLSLSTNHATYHHYYLGPRPGSSALTLADPRPVLVVARRRRRRLCRGRACQRQPSARLPCQAARAVACPPGRPASAAAASQLPPL